MWEKFLDVLKELLIIFKNWTKSKEVKKIQDEVKTIDKKVDNGDIDELNEIWKNEL